MGSHVGFEKCGAADSNGVTNCRFECCAVGDFLVEETLRRRLLVLTAHDDQTVGRKPRAISEGHSFIEVACD